MPTRIKSYQKEFSHTYVLGASPTYELLRARPGVLECVYIHSAYRDADNLTALCDELSVPTAKSDREFNIVNRKENCYVFGVLRKYDEPLEGGKPHIVLVNPSDMGNLGTIIRTMTGLGIDDLAIIEPAADVWNPKTIRASMGALFHIRHKCYASFDEYTTEFPAHSRFAFMLDGAITPEEAPPCPLFSLIFGNEASGLDERYHKHAQSVRIPFRDSVDSFNLSIAVGIGAYEFAKKNGLLG